MISVQNGQTGVGCLRLVAQGEMVDNDMVPRQYVVHDWPAR